MLNSRELCERHFKTELAWIITPSTRNLVLAIFEKLCPDYFWDRAASKTGKYHPTITRQKGGLILHTRLVARMAREIARACFPGQGDTAAHPYGDIMVAAGLLHDMMKEGDPARKGEGRNWSLHGVDVMEAVFNQFFEGNFEKVPREWYLILWAIAGHMGIWTTDPTFRPENISDPEARQVAGLFHLADYTVSRPMDAWFEELKTHVLT